MKHELDYHIWGRRKVLKVITFLGFEPETFKLLDQALTKASLGGHIGIAFGQQVTVI